MSSRCQGQIDFECAPSTAREAVEEAVAHMRSARSGLFIEQHAGDTITLRFPMSWRSMGERVSITIWKNAVIRIHSQCAFSMQLFDWGKNKANVRWVCDHVLDALDYIVNA